MRLSRALSDCILKPFSDGVQSSTASLGRLFQGMIVLPVKKFSVKMKPLIFRIISYHAQFVVSVSWCLGSFFPGGTTLQFPRLNFRTFLSAPFSTGLSRSLWMAA